MMTRYTGAMTQGTDRGPARFAEALKTLGIKASPVSLPGSTRTAVEAAEAIGCTVAEIAKSIVFRLVDSGDVLLVIASGSNRVDTGKLQQLTGQACGKADAELVRSQTGYAIGGVPPFGHDKQVVTFVDEDLFRFEKVWAAAGGPFEVFPTTPDELLAASKGTRADIKA